MLYILSLASHRSWGPKDMEKQSRRSLVRGAVSLGLAAPLIAGCAAPRQSNIATSDDASRKPWTPLIDQRAAAISKDFFARYKTNASIRAKFADLVSELVSQIDRGETDRAVRNLADFIVVSSGADLPTPEGDFPRPPKGWPPGWPWPNPYGSDVAIVLPTMARVLQSQELQSGA
jgi:hypothetical protein